LSKYVIGSHEQNAVRPQNHFSVRQVFTRLLGFRRVRLLVIIAGVVEHVVRQRLLDTLVVVLQEAVDSAEERRQEAGQRTHAELSDFNGRHRINVFFKLLFLHIFMPPYQDVPNMWFCHC
jgi:hypothetical protein